MEGTTRRRNPTFVLEDITPADIGTLKRKTMNLSLINKLSNFLPIVMSVVWMFIGTAFYAVHDNLGWAHGLFMSVNVGWSIGWTMHGMTHFGTFGSRMFTMYHTSVGVLFSGVTVMYMMHIVADHDNNLTLRILKSKEMDSGVSQEGGVEKSFKAVERYFLARFTSLKVFFLCVIWFVVGIIWYEVTNTEYSFFQNVNWILATLTTGGYIHLPMNPPTYQLLFSALYTYIGVPLLSITLGLFMNMCLEVGDSDCILQRAIAPVTREEIALMQDYDVENGDGVIDFKEFVIMAAVRIGSVSPQFMRQLKTHFKELDRKHAGKISYDDFIVSRISTKSSENSLKARQSDKMRQKNPSAKGICGCLDGCTDGVILSYARSVFSVLGKRVFSIGNTAPVADVIDHLGPTMSQEMAPVSSTDDDKKECSETEPFTIYCEDSDSEEVHNVLCPPLPRRVKIATSSSSNSIADVTAPSEKESNCENNVAEPPVVTCSKLRNIRSIRTVQLLSTALRALSTSAFCHRLGELVAKCKIYMKTPTSIAFFFWFVWLTVGTVFYTLEENVTISEGLYFSVSVGYGIFWFHKTSTNLYSKHFTNVHFLIGVLFVSFAMASLSRAVVSHKKLWHNELKKQRIISDRRVVRKEFWCSLVSGFVDTHWEVLCIYIGFLLWTAIGIIWGVYSIGWNGMEAWTFCMSAMSTGGFIEIPHHVATWNLAFVSLYIVVGAPLMAVSCGMVGHLVSNVGLSAELERKLIAPVTQKEIALISILGVEDGDGYIDAAEFTILILMRVEALSPQLIGALFHRFHAIKEQESGTMTYKQLIKRNSLMGSSKSLC